MNETFVGIYVGVVTNLAIAAILNNGPWENLSARTWLVTLGAWNEVLGLLLVASPELLPRLQLLGIYLLGFIRTFRRRLTIVLTRLLRVPRQPRHISVGVGSSLATAFGINARASVRPGGDVEARIEWLIRELDKHDVRLIGLEEEVAKLPNAGKGISLSCERSLRTCNATLCSGQRTRASGSAFSGSATWCSD